LQILYLLNTYEKRYSMSFQILLKMGTDEIFDFLREVQFEFKMEDFFHKLIRINAKEAVLYSMFRYKRHHRSKIVKECVKILFQREREQLAYLH